MKGTLTLFLFASLCLSLSAQTIAGPGQIIPVPARVVEGIGVCDALAEPEVRIDEKAFRKAAGKLVPDTPEAYLLEITTKGIKILAPGEEGAFYARRSLEQMRAGVDALQCCTIVDYPRYGYRGFMYDVSRNFRSVEFLEKQMDVMASVKMNRLHIHLTDGAGWRLQIDAFPRLTSFAAWRTADKYYDWHDRSYVDISIPGHPAAYGGYYTKDDIRRLLAYAHERYIEIIPEIEMPSHSDEVTAAYPELSCTGEKSYDLCLGNPATMSFFKRVLDEVIELFPSEYIHIGGDEANKENWKHCPKCQALMEKEGLADADALQAWFVGEIGAYLNSRGRKMTGWDDLLDGEVPEGATVMAWWNAEAGTKAVRRGHEVIMAPAERCYIQRLPDAPRVCRSAEGIYLPTDSVYVFEPVQKDMTPAQAALIKGVSACMWTEGVDSEGFAEMLMYPRLLAMAEVGWSLPANKDLKGFRERATQYCAKLRERGYETFRLEDEYGQRKAYFQPLEHLARGKKVTYNIPVSERYPAEGPSTLTDGKQGGWSYLPGSGRWQGFLSDIDVVIDLEEVREIHYVGATFMHFYPHEVCAPSRVEVSFSDDGQHFTRAAAIDSDVPEKDTSTLFFLYGAPVSGKARYVRFQAFQGSRPWLFTDEIIVN